MTTPFTNRTYDIRGGAELYGTEKRGAAVLSA